ncbi:TPA: hypothetical protein ACRRXZ_000398 [Morganella morganii]
MSDIITTHCFLCKKQSELQDSHFLPKHIYARLESMVDKDNRHTTMLLNDKGVCRPISRQITEHYFCSLCEQMLRSKGEDYFSKDCFPIFNQEKPKLLNTIQKFVTPNASADSYNYQPNLDQLSLNEEKQLLYFVISMFWRASLTWRNYSSINYPPSILEEMKFFLLGKKNTIETFRIFIDLPFDKPMYGVILPTELKYKNLSTEYLMHIPFYSFRLIPEHKKSDEPSILYGINLATQNIIFRLFNHKYEQRIEKGKRPHSISWN